MKPVVRRTAFAVVLAFVCGAILLSITPFRAMVLSAGTSPETKGYNLARDQGCFHCHGSWGVGDIINPGGGKIPGFQDLTFLMNIKNETELKAWIMDGAPKKVRNDPNYEAAKAKRAVVMPAYRDKIDEGELALLLSFYHGISGTIRPADPEVAKGYETARDHGCFSCHGLAGRFDMPNPGSLVGRIPAWHGEDFHELARNDDEIREWILDGVPQRLANNPLASFFLDRQTIQMPAYRNLMRAEEVESIVTYINWLRKTEAPDHMPSFSEPYIESDEMPY